MPAARVRSGAQLAAQAAPALTRPALYPATTAPQLPDLSASGPGSAAAQAGRDPVSARGGLGWAAPAGIGSGGTGLSPARLIAAGELPVLRLSARVVRIAPADLDAYIKARRQ